MGAAIRLADAVPAMVIGEGLETSGAASVLTGLPAWAAISAGNLAAGLVLPPLVTDVTVAVDRDPAGERAARLAEARRRAEGRRVQPFLLGTQHRPAPTLRSGARSSTLRPQRTSRCRRFYSGSMAITWPLT
jgi:hypothetical protein